MSKFEEPSQPEQPGIEEEGKEPSPEVLREVAEEAIKTQPGLIQKIREWVNSKVSVSKFPTKEILGYESTMGIYGGTLVRDQENRMVYDTRGFWNRVDQWGDRVLRSFDEHHARKPGAMFLRRPLGFLKLLPFIVDSKRYRGTPEQAMENVKRFGLEEYYALHPWGIEVRNPELFANSIGLQDIFRSDQIKHPGLDKIDRFEALGKAAEYLKKLHEKAGGIAEGNVYNFIFTEHSEDGVSKPITMIPTEIWNPEKEVSLIEQKTTDLLDLLASVAMEEYRRTEDWEGVRKAFQAALNSYGDPKVISMVAAFVKRGRLTLPGDVEAMDFKTSPTYRALRNPKIGIAALHNTQRLTVKSPEITAQVRKEIIDACDRYVGRIPEEA